MENTDKSRRFNRPSGVTSSGQPSVRNPGNPFPQEEITHLSDYKDEISVLRGRSLGYSGSHISKWNGEAHENNEKISATWTEIIKKEDLGKLDEIIKKINNLVDPGTKENYIAKICFQVQNHGSLEVYLYVLANLQGSESDLGPPYLKNPHFVPVMWWMHANSPLWVKKYQAILYDMGILIKIDPLSVTPEYIEKCKLMLWLGCAIKPEGKEYTPYNRITEGINMLQRRPDSEAKTKAFAVLDKIKDLFDQVDALDKEGIPREEMEILAIPSLKRSGIKSAASSRKIVE